jgi:tetratricopeptide (TPR) repeat protein
VLRAGPFSDERVVALANRRFVPFFFDLSTRGAAGDADARAFVVAARKDLRGAGVATPPVLFMNAKGEVLAEVSNYATADQVLAAMLNVLKENPDVAKPSDDEAKLQGVAKAQALADLQDLDGALAALEKETGAAAAYLRGRLARLKRDWDAMERAFEKVDDAALADDVRMERAHRAWAERDFEKLRDALKDFPKESNRYTEARYHEGLAHHHLGDPDKALETWKETIKACAQDPWIYRADWAYTEVQDGGRGSFSSAKKGSSLLGRIGYMGNGNPDLRRRR